MIWQSRKKRTARGTLPIIATLCAAVLLFFPGMVSAVDSESPVLDAADAKCLKCHAKSLKKTLEDGQKLSLHIDQTGFADSVHREIGCLGCHEAIAQKKHPKEKLAISSQRAYALDQNQNCGGCHDAKFTQYESSIHSSLVVAGNGAAPMCTDCHGAHEVQAMAFYQPETGLPCKNCHEDIYIAYAQSVHGKARAEGNVIRANNIQAPICADCHEAHEVSAVAAADRLKTVCLDCHEGVAQAHDKWLPNTGLHLEVVSCAACHAPLAERGIDLELYHTQTIGAASVQLNNSDEMGERIRTIDESVDGLDAQELSELVNEANQDGQTADMAVRGRMKVRSGIDAHQLAIKSSAARNCELCHQEGSEAYKNVTVSVSQDDGRRQYYPADEDILKSVGSVGSVSDFYTIGGTRVKLLDYLLILALIGGLAIPVGHITIGWLMKKIRQKENQDASN